MVQGMQKMICFYDIADDIIRKLDIIQDIMYDIIPCGQYHWRKKGKNDIIYNVIVFL